MDLKDYNPWWQGEPDEQFIAWQSSPIRWLPKIIEKIHITNSYSLFFFTGPRQVGKTTALKILIQDELEKKRDPHSILYIQCDEILDFKELGEVLDEYIKSKKARGISRSLIVLDEIPTVREWWRAIKARIDAFQFKNDTIIITGSSSIEVLQERERFPGRRGDGVDIVMNPLTFGEYVDLHIKAVVHQDLDLTKDANDIVQPNLIYTGKIDALFQDYLITGGFPLPIRDYLEGCKIKASTRHAYINWIQGDVRMAGKNEMLMKEILGFILMAKCSPLSWLGISKNTSVNSPHTAQSYVETLEKLHVVTILPYLSQDGIINSKKNKKIHFIDPFIYTVLQEYTGVKVLEETVVESVVAAHLSRGYKTYYWKNGSEVDVIAIINERQIGFEVKWGYKKWRQPLHLKKTYLLVKDLLPTFMATLQFPPVTGT
nr:ATP-binding protein [Candidatus Sigynarchaeum springense]